MNNKIKSEKYRKLSIAALVLGLLIIIPFLVIYLIVIPTRLGYFDGMAIWTPLFTLYPLPLSVAAIVCGSIDIKRIKAGLNSKKGWGMDITGITVGSLYIIFLIFAFVFLVIIFWNL